MLQVIVIYVITRLGTPLFSNGTNLTSTQNRKTEARMEQIMAVFVNCKKILFFQTISCRINNSPYQTRERQTLPFDIFNYPSSKVADRSVDPY